MLRENHEFAAIFVGISLLKFFTFKSSIRGPPFHSIARSCEQSNSQPHEFACTIGRQRYGKRSSNASIHALLDGGERSLGADCSCGSKQIRRGASSIFSIPVSARLVTTSSHARSLQHNIGSTFVEFHVLAIHVLTIFIRLNLKLRCNGSAYGLGVKLQKTKQSRHLG